MKRYIYIVFLCAVCARLLAQQDSIGRYDRPSVCELMVARSSCVFERELELAFREKEISDRFYDHNLGVKTVKFASNDKDIHEDIANFLRQQTVGKKLVGKWFSRNKQTGDMDVHLVFERGLYNVSQAEINLARQTIRGERMLEDAGEKLIHHTFIIVHDYSFGYNYSFFKQKGNSVDTIKRVFDMSKREDVDWLNNQLYKEDLRLSSLAISCVSYLFQLRWSDDDAALFYNAYYTSSANHDQSKVDAFNADKTAFQLDYVGKYKSKINEFNNKGYTNQKLVQKASIRIIDKNIAGLQHQFPQFRIKARLQYGTNPDTPFKAFIGLKEDVTPDSQYEVIEPELHEDGTYTYKRVGIIKPVPGKIWDNRFMATDDNTDDLDATYFKQVSGGELYEGLIIREL